ncbi:hypothetical protein FBY03_111122 [Pseudomonas sp. SJZ079]|uniref:hypothetical protein n=1 Tax=Pseudomonas sp. SJZ079 TaxID=2572887 RepID=UPI00119AD9B8|nr:hypothetical protein [Pseudomonas sp. SJZ079]TWC35074.1 hypothetical protein FBY03_111122 [Pseudomonas sp. SJZ079]
MSGLTLRSVLAGLAPLLLIGAAVLMVEAMQRAEYRKGYQLAQSEGAQALEQLRRQHAEAETERAQSAEASAKQAAKALQTEQARNDQLANDLAAQQRQHRATTDRLTGEIARVNDLYRGALDAPPKPLPACVFTRGFVRVWDEATGARVPEAENTGRAAAQVAEGQATEQLDSGLSQGAFLDHHVRYAEQCRNTAAQLDLLIDAVEGK